MHGTLQQKLPFSIPGISLKAQKCEKYLSINFLDQNETVFRIFEKFIM